MVSPSTKSAKGISTPESWKDRSHCRSACRLLLTQLAAELIGPGARFQGINAMWREPVPEPPPDTVPPEYAADGIHWRLWHREGGGHAAPTHPRQIPSLQCEHPTPGR